MVEQRRREGTMNDETRMSASERIDKKIAAWSR